jgi:hypothetical protein
MVLPASVVVEVESTNFLHRRSMRNAVRNSKYHYLETSAQISQNVLEDSEHRIASI